MFRKAKRLPAIFFFVLSSLVAACGSGNGTTAVPPLSTTAPSTEPTFQAEAIGPLTKKTPLQIVSVFAYEPSEQLVSPATEIGAVLSDARVNKGYGKEPLRPLVVTPTPSNVKAERLLVIAWGTRADFSLERVKAVGHSAMRETIRLGVDDMAYAPIARDQGVTSINADDVAAAFIEGALTEFLDQQNADPTKAMALKHVTYEAGPEFVEAVSKATTRGVDAAHAHIRPKR